MQKPKICQISQFHILLKFLLVYEDDFIKFESKEEVEYFKNRKDIISYNEIANLSLNELNKKADEINEQIQKLELKWLKSDRQGRILLSKNKNYQKN